MRFHGLVCVLSTYKAFSSRVLIPPKSDMIPVIKTDFSLSTIPVEIGPSKKPLQLQLSFDESASFLFVNEHCPPFVECFDEFTLPEIGLAVELHLGHFVIVDHPFATEMYLDDMRDTAGELGFGPGSVLAQSTAVRITDQTYAYRDVDGTYAVAGLSFNILNTTSPSLTGNLSVPLIPSLADKFWMIEGLRIHLNGEAIGSRPSKVLIDPSISHIVIPYEHKAAVRGILELQVSDIYEDLSTGDIYVACPADPKEFRVKLELGIVTRNGPFKINPTYSELSDRPRKLVRKDTHFCQTHYRFGPRLPPGRFDRHTWIIGNPLFHNRPLGIVFDSPNGRIIVTEPGSPQSAIIKYPVFPMKMWMPRYNPTVFIEQPNDSVTVLKLKQTGRADGGYVLRSTRLIGGHGIGMLDFCLRNIDHIRSRRADGLNRLSNASRELPGLYHLVDRTEKLWLNQTDGSVSLVLTKAVSLDIPIYVVTILTTSSISMINLRRVTNVVVASGDLMLPPPVTVNDTPTDTSSSNSTCCICLCEFAAGDVVQSLAAPCPHKFHKACVDEWFKTGTHKCPLCKAQMPYSSNPTVVRGGAAEAPRMGGGLNIYDFFANMLAALDRGVIAE